MNNKNDKWYKRPRYDSYGALINTVKGKYNPEQVCECPFEDNSSLDDNTEASSNMIPSPRSSQADDFIDSDLLESF